MFPVCCYSNKVPNVANFCWFAAIFFTKIIHKTSYSKYQRFVPIHSSVSNHFVKTIPSIYLFTQCLAEAQGWKMLESPKKRTKRGRKKFWELPCRLQKLIVCYHKTLFQQKSVQVPCLKTKLTFLFFYTVFWIFELYIFDFDFSKKNHLLLRFFRNICRFASWKVS